MMEKQTNFVVRDPNYQARIYDSFGRQGFMQHIGASIIELAPGRCRIDVPFGEHTAQQHGFFHGGVIGAIADNAGAYAAFTLIEAHQSMLTVEYKVNLLSPGQGESLSAQAQLVRAGRTLSVSAVDVFALKNAIQRHCATAIVTMMLLPDRGDS